MALPGTKQVMDGAAVNRSVTRLAHEILERNGAADQIMLVGILTRGEPLANRLQTLIYEIAETQVPMGSVNITFHRDDFRERLVVPQVKGSDIPGNIDDRVVVLVDDVLFTGRTIRAAMDEINAFGRPKSVQLAVLVDRGHRELPIRADFVGKNIPTQEGEHVKVQLKEVDGKDNVALIRYVESSS